MSRLSETVIDKIANKWTQNLKSDVKRREKILVMSSLTDLCRMPKKKQIIGRFLRLFQDGIKNKTKRIAVISEELVCLLPTLNFPTVSKQQVSAKISRLAIDYISYRKKKTEKFEKQLKNVFDTTKIEGFWLCKEDKNLYKKQMESQIVLGTLHQNLQQSLQFIHQKDLE